MADYDILHSYMGYRTCYYRTFAVGSASRAMVDAYKRCRDYLDASIELIRPGRTTAEVASVWPRAQEFGFPSEEAAFALQMGHGIGLAIWERPMISRLVSLSIRTRSSRGWCSRSKPSGPQLTDRAAAPPRSGAPAHSSAFSITRISWSISNGLVM